MITIVDYGIGNIQALGHIYKSLGIPFSITQSISDLYRASHLILPGVGSFDWAITRLECSGLRPALDDLVLNKQVPVLGICVGMQMMASSSEEGSLPGLGWIPGEVKRFDVSFLSSRICLPHIGWNDVVAKPHALFDYIVHPRFYFLHTYHFSPSSAEHVLAETHYGYSFASAVSRENVIGVQFHPEKSHHWGIHLLKNFGAFQP